MNRLTERSQKKSTESRKLALRSKSSRPKMEDILSIKIVAQTAATLSHEINNPLMAITALVEILQRDCHNMPEGVRDKIIQIGYAAERIKKVTEKLTDIDTINYRDTAAGRLIDIDSLLHPADNLFPMPEHKLIK